MVKYFVCIYSYDYLLYTVYHTSLDANTQTHHQCCILESLGVSGLATDTLTQATRPRFIRPSGILLAPLVTPFQPEPSGCSVRHLYVVVNGSPSPCPRNAQGSIGLTEGMTCNPLAAHLHWHTPGSPSIPAAVLPQLLVLRTLPLLCLLHPLLPGHSQLQ